MLKTHQIKNWLKHKVQFSKFREPTGEVPEDYEQRHAKIPYVKKEYLMSDQEIKQNQIIETIFTKFDTDGSGSLDLNEIIDLFRQNMVNLDKDTVKEMFQSDEFTLKNFKQIVSSEESLQRFKDILLTQRKRILHDIERGSDKKVAANDEELSRKFDGMKQFRKVHYLPQTFETMMESFGLNLQRKLLYEKFYKAHQNIEAMTKSKEVSKTELENTVVETAKQMRRIIEISGPDPSSLKNNHNQLFLSLLDQLEHQKTLAKARASMLEAKNKQRQELESARQSRQASRLSRSRHSRSRASGA